MSTQSAKKAIAARKAEVEKRNGAGENKPTLYKFLEDPKQRGSFEAAIARGHDVDQLIRDVIVSVKRNPDLLACDHVTVLGAAMTCAQLGLRVGVLGHAWIVPFSGKGQLIIGYQGYRELAHRSGLIASIEARTVHEKDQFDIQLGTQGFIQHRPYMKGPRGKTIGYYTVANYTNGGYAFDHISKWEADDHRQRFAAKKHDGPWNAHFDSMALKTCALRMFKWMPKSPDMEYAIHADNRIRADLSRDGITSGVLPAPELQLIERAPDDGEANQPAEDEQQEFSDEPWQGE